MKWFNNISFVWKQVLTAGLYLVVIVIVMGFGTAAMNHLSQDTEEVSSNILPRLNYLLQADRDLYQSLVAERTLVFMPSSHARFNTFKQDHDDNIEQALERVKKAEKLATSPEQLALYKSFDELLEQWRIVSDEVEIMSSSDPNKAFELGLNESQMKFDSMRKVVDQLTELTERESEIANQRAKQTVQSAQLSIVLVAALGMIIVFVLSYFAARAIANTILEVKERILDIADGEGDLTQRFNVQRSDELGQLEVAFNHFLDGQSTTIALIQNTMTELTKELSSITALIHSAQQATSNQQSENDQIATAVTQMAATVQEVSRNATDAAEATRNADKDVQNGRSVVQQTVSGIQDLASDIEQNSLAIGRVESGSHEIGTVMDVISSIAEQTNLLALNAAIEAARAGEQGRGFAVVADEVRTLAQRTQESTSSIRDVVERLQSESAAAVKAMTSSQNRAHQVVERAGLTGEVLEQMTGAVQTIAEMNAQIATAAEQQSTTAEQISENGMRIKTIAEETFAITMQVTEANTQVMHKSTEVSELVSRFKVSG
ncbi:methyl-accepting chemotaxis protein [Echinimonas agarilytica]|uniref:Methyl-accepting chemotaxis protein n=1 Tax=Echinimonas agarilytica TaxID=1215918 RepID=A0AA41W5L5_9GAMM|nr:methyl-accepting chemotaxis protein [Echinimonas agarilytica]